MLLRRGIVGLGVVLLAGAAARADVKVVFERSERATPEFKFKTVPSPAKDDAGARATFTIVEGRRDGNGAEISALNDGKLPGGQDEPRSSFFFAQGLDGGRIVVDLGRVVEVRQVNTYSWHADTRGPQVYSVHGADGTAKEFSGAPKRPADPEKCGWTYLADVDTRPVGKKVEEAGGQYGVSVSGSSGVLGKFRYLLLDINETEDDDKFGNTFYSEIDVVTTEKAEAAPAAAPPSGPAAAADVPQPEVFHTADGKYQISIDTSVAPGLREWADHSLAPVLLEWYPKIVAMLPSEGYEAPTQVTVVFQNPGHGVAATGGTRITCAAAWFERNLEGEARGAVVHELVHVVQQYGRGRRAGGTPAPGWLTEGIADYIRWFKYEPQSHGADVRDPARVKYDGSYRVSANFLNWASLKYDADLVKKLNAALRDGKYAPNLWQDSTGKRVEELGEAWRASLTGH